MLRTKNDAAPPHRGSGGAVGAGLGLAARVHRDPAELHCAVCAGGGRPGHVDWGWWHDVFWPSRLCWYRRLCHRLGLCLAPELSRLDWPAAASPVALAGLAAGLGANRRPGLGPGCHHAQTLGPLLAAVHHCLGAEPVFSVRQHGRLGRAHRHWRLAAAAAGRAVTGLAALARAADLGGAAAEPVDVAQPARLARGACHSLAQKRACHGRINGRGYRALPRQSVCAGRTPGRGLRLVLRPLATLCESDPL